MAKEAGTFKVVVAKDSQPSNSTVIRSLVTNETLTQLKEISDKSNLSMQQLTARMIEYAICNLEYVEV